MGWAYGIINGKEVGYSVKAKCEHPGCSENIDRGLAYVCGGMHGGDGNGCGGYFCAKHLFYIRSISESRTVQVCESCFEQCMKNPEEYEDPFAKLLERVKG